MNKSKWCEWTKRLITFALCVSRMYAWLGISVNAKKMLSAVHVNQNSMALHVKPNAALGITEFEPV